MHLEAVCPQCKTHYCGWALQNQSQHLCDKCGSVLEIRQEDNSIPADFSLESTGIYTVSSGLSNRKGMAKKDPLFFISRN